MVKIGMQLNQQGERKGHHKNKVAPLHSSRLLARGMTSDALGAPCGRTWTDICRSGRLFLGSDGRVDVSHRVAS